MGEPRLPEDPLLIRLIKHHIKATAGDDEVTIEDLEELESYLHDEIKRRKETA